jgi:hypothetical protein
MKWSSEKFDSESKTTRFEELSLGYHVLLKRRDISNNALIQNTYLTRVATLSPPRSL